MFCILLLAPGLYVVSSIFCVSGNYGNKLDTSVPPMASSTPPTNAVFDGASYYYLPWNDSKPCCVVDSHWEDIQFRLGPLNQLYKTIERLVCIFSSCVSVV